VAARFAAIRTADITGRRRGAGNTMDIHKPKPVHNLREFLSEISVIVCGILIALAGEQIVERLEWRHKVAEAREGVSHELGEDFGQAQERLRTYDCVEKRLDAIATVIDDAARTGRLPPLGLPGQPPNFTWDGGVWRSVVAAQTSTHMTREDLKAYSAIYEFIGQIDLHSSDEMQAWSKIYQLSGPGRRFNDAEAAAFRDAVARARLDNRYIGLAAVRSRQIADAWKTPYDGDEFLKYANRPLSTVAVCQPIDGTPPSDYSQTMGRDWVALSQQHPITLESAGMPAMGRR
jgi:hypothetical protein